MSPKELQAWRDEKGYPDAWYILFNDGRVSEEPVPLNEVSDAAEMVLNMEEAPLDPPPWIEYGPALVRRPSVPNAKDGTRAAAGVPAETKAGCGGRSGRFFMVAFGMGLIALAIFVLGGRADRFFANSGPNGTAAGDASLSPEGILVEANVERAERGLPALRESEVLNRAAERKVDDMFSREYFAHNDPDGNGIDAIVADLDYPFIVVGEILAFGDFENDRDMVEEWMGSPSHRETILSEKYHEIGASVKRDVFDEKDTWIGVQVFATPLSASPYQVDASLPARIEENERELERIRMQIEEAQDPEEHNALVDAHNELQEETRRLVARYNEQVEAFNRYIESF